MNDHERDIFGLVDADITFVDDESVDFDPRRERHVMTVLGPVDPGALGVTLPHEHLLVAPSEVTGTEPDYLIDDRDAALADVESFGFAGGGAIVDCTPADTGRDLKGLLWLAHRIGIHIIATAGFHMDVWSGPRIGQRSSEELARELIRELRDGDPASGVRPGLLKAASSLNTIHGREERAFRAVARAHLATGVPIMTHTEAGTMALEQIDLLVGEGVAASRIAVSHLDRRFDDDALLHDVLATGATIGFDQLGKPRYGPDEPKASVIAGLVAEGFGDRILLSHDLARRSLRPGCGGSPGFTYLLDRFVFMLLDAGVGAGDVRRMLIDNPARMLTVRPPSRDS